MIYFRPCFSPRKTPRLLHRATQHKASRTQTVPGGFARDILVQQIFFHRPRSRSQHRFPKYLQPFFGLVNILPGGPEPLLHVRRFSLELPAAFFPVMLQETMIACLQGFRSGRKHDLAFSDPIALQLVSADLVVQNRHIEGPAGKFSARHTDHPPPA